VEQKRLNGSYIQNLQTIITFCKHSVPTAARHCQHIVHKAEVRTSKAPWISERPSKLYVERTTHLVTRTSSVKGCKRRALESERLDNLVQQLT